jgi:hypothetical protein
MNQVFITSIYILIGLSGGAWHYAKKRYIDKTTSQDFKSYLFEHPSSTYQAVIAIFGAEYALSLAHVGDLLSLPEVVSALTAGYAADSQLNRCVGPDANNH